MAIVQGKPDKNKPVRQEDRVDERLMNPGDYEVTPQTTFDVVIMLKKVDIRWVIVGSDGGGVVTHTVVFRMWNYDEMVEMRKMAMNFDSTRRVHMIDNDALNRLKIQKLLVSWTFGDDNPRLKLNHVQGVLTDEAWGVFKRLQPNIISYILERANNVFEFNN